MSEEQTTPQADGDAPVPSDVAKAARLWVSDQQFEAPDNAVWLNKFVWSTLRKVVAVGIITAVFVLMAIEARGLIGMLIIATFFALAIIPGVNSLVARFGMRRGAAVAIVYLIAIVTLVLLVVVLIPAVVTFADEVQAHISGWVDSLNQWSADTLGTSAMSGDAVAARMDEFLVQLKDWASSAFGLVTSGIGLIFDIVTIAAFTFYIAVDYPKIRRALMTRMPPERQHVFAWISDTSIEQTGGYFYSRLLLMLVNGGLGFVVMVLLGMPLVYAVPMALFMGFVSEFIPMIGTYIGAIIPLLVMLAVQGLVPALLLLAWVIVYQQLENYWLSPRFSSKTMELNGAVAFGAALAGGAIAGPMGAFMALPIAALITAIVKNAGRTYAVVVEDLEGPAMRDDVADQFDPDGARLTRHEAAGHARWQVWKRS